LEGIKGIGKNTVDLLLKEFRSVKNIRERSIDELKRVVGEKRARLLQAYFEENENSK
jgi:excinuclease ABC subunit C